MERSRRVALGGGLSVDLDSDTLRDGAGAAVALRPQASAVLRHLAANVGRVVTKDELMAEIAEAIANRLGGGAGVVQEAGRIAARRKSPRDLDAYELYLLGTERLERITRTDVEAAIGLLERAVTIDPGFARAWIELSHCYANLVAFGVDPDRNQVRSAEAAERALALDPGDAEAHAAVGWRLGETGDLTRAKAELDQALLLAPNAAEILTFYVAWVSSFGEPERGAGMADRVIRMEPNFPIWKARNFSYAYFMAGRYPDALAMIDRLQPENYWPDTWAYRAGALAELGRLDEARDVSELAVLAQPDLSIEALINNPGYNDTEHRRFVDTLRPAGFRVCATHEVLAKLQTPSRLPECTERGDGTAP